MSSTRNEAQPAEPAPPRDRERWKIGGAATLLVVLGFALAYQFVGPPPPKTLVMATGAAGGGYHAFGERCATVMARSGIELQLAPSEGAIENIEAVRSGAADVALVQGGTSPEDVEEFGMGIASVFFEPLWVFHRAGLEVERLTDLRGRRLEVGSDGGGTRPVALDLLRKNGIDGSAAELGDAPAADAAEALIAGEVDAVFLVMSPQSETIERLMGEEGTSLRLMDMGRGLAYSRACPYLSEVTLPQGVLDFERNLPDRDIGLVAPTAILMGDAELHDALVPLLIQAAEEAHGVGDLLAEPGTFPTLNKLDVPASRAATEYFKNGSSFLYRVFPFGVAATLDRLKILLLPIITLLLPIFKMAPPLLRWRTRRKIFLWYRHLERIERESRATPESCIAQLDDIEKEIVESVDVPASYMEELHQLRLHLDRVRTRIVR